MDSESKNAPGSAPVDIPSSDIIQFPCKSCGAKLTFAPGAGSLACQYCGYAEPIPTSREAVQEHAFESYAARKGDVGFGVERKHFSCAQCGAQTAVEPHITSFRCVFCGSDKVAGNDERQVMRPESLLPFAVGAERALEAFRQWLAGLWFRPNALKRLAQPGALSGIYLPFWTYDTLTHSFWTAESGEYYYVTRTVTDSNGQQRIVQEQHVRWRWVRGTFDCFFDDVLAPGSPSLPRPMLERIEPFPTDELVAYSPEFLSGFLAEDYRADMTECWPVAKRRIDDAIEKAIIRRIPGDTYRSLSVDTSYHNRTYKLCLLPVWAGGYQFQGKTYTYAVNGQTAKVAGDAPYSWLKIAALVVTLLGLAAGIYAATGR